MDTGTNIAAERVRVLHGDSREVLRQFPDNHFDSCVTDPPYALVSITKRFGKPGSAPAKGNDAYMRASAGFMGANWDTGETAFDPAFWAEVLRVLKPGGHVVAFSGTRTYHRMAVAIEDAGFEVRDCLQWIYAKGFPKSLDIAKQLDKRGGVWRGQVTRALPKQSVAKGVEYERVDKGAAVTDDAKRWEGFGTALKPAVEPVCLARKPISEANVASNVMEHGTGAINIDGCRILYASDADQAAAAAAHRSGQDSGGVVDFAGRDPASLSTFMQKADLGRWPANVIIDDSAEVSDQFPTDGDGVSASRFFFSAKADAGDRIGSKHPTVKPVDLMQWLVRLITPPGGLVLEPFAGSGTTGEAAFREGMRCVMIEREEGFVADIKRRIGLLLAGPEERSRAAVKAKIDDGRILDDPGPLFGGTDIAQAGRQAGRYTATSRTRTNDWPDGPQVVNE